jgi:transposase
VLAAVNDAERVERMLGEGSLCCPVCGGRLARWDYALERVAFGPGRQGPGGAAAPVAVLGVPGGACAVESAAAGAAGRMRRV